MGSDYANAVLIARHRPENSHRLVARSTDSACDREGQPRRRYGVDVERCTGAHVPDGVAQRIDARHQQVRPAVKQVHCKEERSTRDPNAAIIRHEGSMSDLGKRRNALR